MARAFQRVKQDETPNAHMGWKAHATTSTPFNNAVAASVSEWRFGRLLTFYPLAVSEWF